MISPQPITVETCNTCHQPWSTHIESSQRRADKEFYDQIDSGDYQSSEGISSVPAGIDFRDCVLALQEANRGPMGYTGAMGMSGRDA